VGLVVVVVGVLAEDYDFDCVEGSVARPDGTGVSTIVGGQREGILPAIYFF